MKVETNLKAGGMLQDATYQAGNAVNQVSGFVSQANQQAENLTNSVVSTTKSLWNSVTGAFGF
jgi:hypothetical protein